MLTYLDLLVIVFMALAAATLLSVVLMFAIKNRTFRRVCLYVTTALGAYTAAMGIYIGFKGLFFGQLAVGVATALALIGGIVMERISSKGNDKLFLAARITSAAALVIGLINAIV